MATVRMLITWLVTWLLVLGTGTSEGRDAWFVPTSDDESMMSSVKTEWRVEELGQQSKKELQGYLTKFGYDEASFGRLTDGSYELVEQVKDLQFMGGLHVTGVLDKATVELVNRDRCDVKDPNPRQKRLEAEEKKRNGRSGRFRRFTHQGTKWENPCKLRWQYVHDPRARNAHIGEYKIRRALSIAMKLWEDSTNVKFTEDRRSYEAGSDEEPEIMIRFTSARLGHRSMDSYAFEGRGGFLAHAFYPLHQKDIAGDVHFDDDENYSLNTPKRKDEVDMHWISAHELGHTLGLDHSHNEGALMFPWAPYDPDVKTKLTHDDQVGIQLLYGGKVQGYCDGKVPVTKPPVTKSPVTKPPVTKSPVTKPPVTKSPVTKPPVTKSPVTKPPVTKSPVTKSPVTKFLCPNSPVTAIWSRDSETLIAATSDDKLYHLKKDGGGLTDEGVVEKRRYFDVRGNIQAAYRSNLGKTGGRMYTIIFTSEGYYIYDGKQRISGPHSFNGRNDPTTKREFCKMSDANDRRPLRLNFPKSVKKIDGVMSWQRNNKVYFFTGSTYWRFDEKKQKFDCGYPRLIKTFWRGGPRDIDAVYSSDGQTFFVKGNTVSHLDNRKVRVTETKDLLSDLMKCEERAP